jgi:type II secretory pathway pseudopilin PulG
MGWIAYVMAWLVAALFWALAAASGSGRSPRETVIYGLLTMGPAAVMGVGVWTLSRRVEWNWRSWRFLGIHALALLVFVGVYATSTIWPDVLNGRSAEALARFKSSPVLVWSLLMGTWLYLLVAGFSYAIRAQRRARAVEAAAAEAQLLAQQAQLAALRAQVNPHFLFNALHSVGALVASDPVRADRALEQLGDLLRTRCTPRTGELAGNGRLQDYLAFGAATRLAAPPRDAGRRRGTVSSSLRSSSSHWWRRGPATASPIARKADALLSPPRVTGYSAWRTMGREWRKEGGVIGTVRETTVGVTVAATRKRTSFEQVPRQPRSPCREAATGGSMSAPIRPRGRRRPLARDRLRRSSPRCPARAGSKAATGAGRWPRSTDSSRTWSPRHPASGMSGQEVLPRARNSAIDSLPPRPVRGDGVHRSAGLHPQAVWAGQFDGRWGEPGPPRNAWGERRRARARLADWPLLSSSSGTAAAHSVAARRSNGSRPRRRGAGPPANVYRLNIPLTDLERRLDLGCLSASTARIW